MVFTTLSESTTSCWNHGADCIGGGRHLHVCLSAEGALLSVKVERVRVVYKKALDRPFCTLSLLSSDGTQLEPPVGKQQLVSLLCCHMRHAIVPGVQACITCRSLLPPAAPCACPAVPGGTRACALPSSGVTLTHDVAACSRTRRRAGSTGPATSSAWTTSCGWRRPSHPSQRVRVPRGGAACPCLLSRWPPGPFGPLTLLRCMSNRPLSDGCGVWPVGMTSAVTWRADANVVVEIKHWKSKEKRFSVLAWSFLPAHVLITRGDAAGNGAPV